MFTDNMYHIKLYALLFHIHFSSSLSSAETESSGESGRVLCGWVGSDSLRRATSIVSNYSYNSPTPYNRK